MSEAPAFAADESSRAREDVVARGPRPAVRALVQFVALSAIGIGLFMFHGISLQLTPWSQAIVNGIVKYAYPATGQKDTTVVLFREENLAELDEAYPVSYQRHAEVLEALSAYEPRAVFVDFAFIDPRSPEDTERLGQAICELSAGGRVPVYLASPPPAAAGHGDSEINQPLLACAKPVSAEMDAERGVSGVLTYQNGVCTTPEAGRPCKRSAFMPSPAFAMAAARAGIAPADAEPMEIIWGNLASSLNEKWMNCTTVGPLQHLVEMLRETPLATKRKCPHTNTISVVHLLGAEDPDVRDAIRGKSVFYGGSFQMVGDRVISPVYDDLPGVYLHAMAYDNLVTFRGNYKRADHQDMLSSVVNGLLLLFTVLLLLLVEKPPALARRLLGRLAGVSPVVKWLALGLAVLSVVITVTIPTSLSAVFLLLPLLLGVVAVLHLATAPPKRPAPPRQFIRVAALGVTIVAVAVALFLIVDTEFGIEAALLLVVLPAYFVYRALVVRDVLFVATTGLLIGAAIVSFLPPINLGPRNIIAYVAFFEVARHVMRYADNAAARYLQMRQAHPSAEDWGVSAGMLRAVDWLFNLCVRGDEEDTAHGDTTAHPA